MLYVKRILHRLATSFTYGSAFSLALSLAIGICLFSAGSSWSASAVEDTATTAHSSAPVLETVPTVVIEHKMIMPACIEPSGDILAGPARIATPASPPCFNTPIIIRTKIRPARKGLLARLLAPVIDPVTESLDSASSGLEQTAAQIGALAAPMVNLSGPLVGLQQPMNGLQAPLQGLQQPLSDLRQPMIDLGRPLYGLQEPLSQLGEPVWSLSRSAGNLGTPMTHLSNDLQLLRQPLNGMAQPLSGMQQPLRGLVEPMRALPGPLNGLVLPLTGLQRPLNGVSGSLHALRTEVHDLRSQIERVYDAIVDIGRNVTLAIVFGSSVIAYAIWTHRKVPSVVEPTIATVETVPAGQGNAEVAPSDHQRTIIKTESVSQAHAHTQHDVAQWQATHNHDVSEKNPPNDQSPPPGTFKPPGE